MSSNETTDTSMYDAPAGSQEWDMVVDALADEGTTPNTPSLELSVQPRHDVIGTDSSLTTTQVCSTVKARSLPENDETQRAPVDMMVALDVSGSMHGDKLDLCKTSLKLLLRQLLPHDRFGLVSFSDQALLEVPLQKLDQDHRKAALDKIERLHTRGCTNISDAIGTTVPVLQMVEDPNEVRTVFLLTDGLANMGISNKPDLVKLTRNWFTPGNDKSSGATTSGPPITMHCFGYGSDHDSSLLKEMTGTTPGGTYYFVENDSNVLGAFGDALGGVLSVVAQTAVLHLAISPEAKNLGVNIVNVFHDNQVKMADGSYTVTVGDFYADESRDVLMEITLANNNNNNTTEIHPIPHVTASLSYTDTLLKLPAAPGRVVCHITRLPGSDIVSSPNQHVMVQWLRIQTARELAQAEQLARQGELGTARARLDQMVHVLLHHSHGVDQNDPLVQHLVEDLQRLRTGLVDRHTYAQFGQQAMSHTFQTHTMQRCSESTSYSRNTYRSAKKAMYTKKFGS